MKFRLAHTGAVVLAAGLLLVSCSSDSDSDENGDAIDGVQTEDSGQPDDEGGASETPTDEGRWLDSEIELPEDVTLVFDWEEPEAPDEVAALASAADYMRSIAKGVVEQNPDDPAYQGISTGQARDYVRDQIQQWVDGGWTKTGTDRYYDASIDHVGDVIGVEFCRDNSEMHGKEVESGEIVPEEESGEFAFLSHYSITMAEAPGVDGFWQATAIEVEGDAAQCAE